MILIFNKKYDTIELHLKRKGVCIMNMKITKKILAAHLALVSTFTIVNAAEPVEIEKPTAVSANVTNKESGSKHKILKGVLAAGAVTALAAGGIFGLVHFLSKDDENKACDERKEKLLYAAGLVMYCYSVPKIRECIENFSKTRETESSRAFKYLFGVLDGKEGLNKYRVEESLKYIMDHTFDPRASCFDDLGAAIEGADVYENQVYDDRPIDISKGSCFYPQCDTISISVLGSRYYPCIVNNFERFKCSINPQVTYNLKSVLYDNNGDWSFAESYIRHEDGEWYKHSFDGNCTKISKDLVESKLKYINCCTHLIYTKELSR